MLPIYEKNATKNRLFFVSFKKCSTFVVDFAD